MFVGGPQKESPVLWIPQSTQPDTFGLQPKNLIIIPDSVSAGAGRFLDFAHLLVLDTCSVADSGARECIGARSRIAETYLSKVPALSEGAGPVEMRRKHTTMLIWHHRWGKMRGDRASQYHERYDIIVVIDWPEDELMELRATLRPQKVLRIGTELKKSRRLNIITAGPPPFRLEISKRSDNQVVVASGD